MSSEDESEEKCVSVDEEPEVIAPDFTDADTMCTICYAEFIDPDDLQIHIDQVHKTQITMLRKCQFCYEVFPDIMKYAEHVRDVHLSSFKCCTSCWRVFDNIEDYAIHIKKHFIIKFSRLFRCSQCKLRFEDIVALKRHEFESHDVQLKSEGVMLHAILPYLSAILKVKSTTFLESLNSNAVFICTGCSFSSVDLEIYKTHIISHNCNVYVCHTCSNVFKTKRNIAKHMKYNCSLFGSNNTKFCTICKSHISLMGYGKHKVSCKPIKCYICDIVFQNMNEWSEHQSRKHTATSVSVETCKFCLKRFVGKVAMTKHINKIHKPDFHLYKYLCVYCKSVYKHPQKLFAHFITQHKELNPYTCKICNETFKLRKKFTIHIKLSHKSEGFVEFDENYHVFFTDKKSENPFVPKSLYVEDSQLDESNNFVGNDVDFDTNTKDNNSMGHEDTDTHKDNNSNVPFETDFTDAKETEKNETEVDAKPKLKRKRKIKNENSIESSDDDEPLLNVRKRVKLTKKTTPVSVKKKQTNKNSLTCKLCRKYCYTQQNYQHHVSLHSKYESKKCIKCAKVFKSSFKLNEHIIKDHKSSKLTETLKSLIEKRKTGRSLSDDLPTQEKFRRTIKKVKTTESYSSAEITPVSEKLSVQKFLENFVPDDNKANMPTSATITITNDTQKDPIIKMTKFKPSPISNSLKLAMPVKFVDRYPERVEISIKMVTPKVHEDYSEHSNGSPDVDRYETIPDVAEEVMLENSENELNTKKDLNHKLVIPNLKIEIEDCKIAHLLPEAPYYKIVSAKDVLGIAKEEKREENVQPTNAIELSDGTKFVSANPLAHLLGYNSEMVMESLKTKYYKAKNKNFQGMLVKALTKLDKPSHTKPRRKKNVTIDTEQ